MYRSFLAAPDIFAETPSTLGDVRAHTLLSNAALVSSDGISEGGECYPSLQDGVRAVQVVFAAEESARTRHTVAVNLI